MGHHRYSRAISIRLLFADQLSRQKNIILKERENELVTIISYFEVYIENKNNVYQSFNLLLPYCSLWMKEKIENMLKEIDKDKSVQPFVNFAKNFQQVAFSSLMLSDLSNGRPRGK